MVRGLYLSERIYLSLRKSDLDVEMKGHDGLKRLQVFRIFTKPTWHVGLWLLYHCV